MLLSGALLSSASGFQLKQFARGCAAAATCGVALFHPLPSNAKEDSIQIDINTPYVLDLVKSGEARGQALNRLSFLAESVQNAVGPAVSVRPPTDIKSFTKKALSGGASIEVNGQTVGVQVVGSTKGALTVELSNPLIPAIPFAGLASTPSVVNEAAEVAASAAPGVVETMENILSVKMEQPKPFWSAPINEDVFRLDVDAVGFHKAFTPLDVVGGGSLGLGVVYAASYAYYIAEQENAAREAAEKKTAMAAKKKAAAAKAETSKKAEAIAKAKEELPETQMEAINKELKVQETKEAEQPEVEGEAKKESRLKKILGLKRD